MVEAGPTFSALTRLPLRTRRRALRGYWRVLCVTRRAPRFQLQRVFQSILRAPAAEAARLDREAVFQDLMFGLEWAALLKRTHRQLHADARSVAFGDTSLFQQLAASKQAVILAPLHMGCFALPFAKIMHDFFRGRRMIILRARQDRPHETAAMERIAEIGVDMRFLNISEKHNFVDAIKQARAGAVVVNFVDLPASYGGAVRVCLFNQPVRIAMGIAALGRLTEATVVPLSIRSSSRGDDVQCGRPFQTVDSGTDEKDRVTGLITRHIETSIAAAPEQWHMWRRFDEFRDAGADQPMGTAA